MDFKNKESGIWILGLVLALMVLGMGYLSAQTPVTSPVTDSSAPSSTPGYGATPVPTQVHKHKNLMTSNKIANEGTQPGQSIDGENPTITMVPVGTVASTSNP